MTNRYEEAGVRRSLCFDCGKVGDGEVEVDTWSGVAMWTCPNCGTAQENPQSIAEDAE
jgi:hypothetical protein